MTSKPNPNPLVQLIEIFIEGKWSGILINFIFIPLLVLIVLLLPPISLADRVMSLGYETIGINGGSLADQGMEINFLPQGVNQSFYAKLSTIPRSTFLEGSSGQSLLTAAESIPSNLIMRSPYYRIQWRGTPASAVLLRVPIPRDVENPHTLDLYAWDGTSWQWLPSNKLVNEGVMESELGFTPESVVVMATHPINPSVSTDYVLNSAVPDQVWDSLVEINPQGLILADNGKIDNTLQALPPEIQNSTLSIIPTIKNWGADGQVRSDLIDNLLVDEVLRRRHVAALADLVQRNAYQGIDIDYRGISPDLKAEYTVFLQDLRAALPQNKQLSVTVGLPRQVSDETWETDAFDWQAIGQIADIVKVPTSPDPADYVHGGKMETLLNWAVGQVNRYKIQLLLSTMSTEEVNGALRNITYQQALEPLGQAAAVGENTVVNPGDEMDFTLAGLPATTGIQFDRDSGAYWYAYLDQNDVQRTIYLENAASIARKLQFVAQYNLRGVAIQNLLDENNDAQIWTVISKFLDLVIPPVESQYSVVWRVQNQDGGVIDEQIADLSNPNFRFTVPEGGQEYQVVAAIAAGQDTTGAVPRGRVDVLIATST
ncbi:MAG: hypothetical protein D6768_05740, partial [Chloroflexi bacterium]